jgi:two-component system sensor histidine kinase RegB
MSAPERTAPERPTSERPALDRIAAALIPRVTARASAPGEATARKNMFQLIHLRWLAVFGQVATIIVVQNLMHIDLPLLAMALVLAALIGLNLLSLLRLKSPTSVSNRELFIALALDAVALTAQLYLSGGASNPFTSLFLLQVILAAVLLEVWSTWAMVAITTVCFAGLTVFYRPIDMSGHPGGDLFAMHIQGMLVGFALDATLLVIFVTRINANLRARDSRLADLRQQAAEEDHIVRMGLLASGAAHELGTPLATLDVILSDWRRVPKLAADPELAQEIEDMRAGVQRCKAIVTGVLLSAGEARGERPVVTTLRAFMDEVVEDWRATRAPPQAAYDNQLGDHIPTIVADSALKQVIHNVLDNAFEASPRRIDITAAQDGDDMVLTVADDGPGFTPEMLADFGKPYNSSKGRPGGGLGLFLVVNVMRKLGGRVVAENRPGGGAQVMLVLPLSALALEAAHVG